MTQRGLSCRIRALLILAVGLGVLCSVAPRTALAAGAPTSQTQPEGAEEEVEDGGLCSHVPWVIGDVCDAVGDVVGGGLRTIVGGGANAILSAVVGFVVDGASWMLDGVAGFIDRSTQPDLRAGWFEAAYRDMAVVAALGILPFLLLALIQAILRQDAGMMLRAAFGYVPLAAIGTAAAVVIVDLLVQLTDELSGWIGRGMGDDLSSFATGVGKALAAVTVPAGATVAGFAALIGGAVVAFAAFVIWLELLLRQAAIYVAVLFFPLAFTAMVWPATAHWLRRLTQGLVAIILSKFVIVAVMALAASALDANVEQDGFAVVVSGAALLSLAALAPYVLLRLIPVFEAGLSSQLEGTFRRPTAAAASPVTGTQMVGLLRNRASSGAGQSSGAAAAGVATGTAVGGTLATGSVVGQGSVKAAAARAAKTADVATPRTGEDSDAPASGHTRRGVQGSRTEDEGRRR